MNQLAEYKASRHAVCVCEGRTDQAIKHLLKQRRYHLCLNNGVKCYQFTSNSLPERVFSNTLVY